MLFFRIPICDKYLALYSVCLKTLDRSSFLCLLFGASDTPSCQQPTESQRWLTPKLRVNQTAFQLQHRIEHRYRRTRMIPHPSQVASSPQTSYQKNIEGNTRVHLAMTRYQTIMSRKALNSQLRSQSLTGHNLRQTTWEQSRSLLSCSRYAWHYFLPLWMSLSSQLPCQQ